MGLVDQAPSEADGYEVGDRVSVEYFADAPESGSYRYYAFFRGQILGELSIG